MPGGVCQKFRLTKTSAGEESGHLRQQYKKTLDLISRCIFEKDIIIRLIYMTYLYEKSYLCVLFIQKHA